MRTRQSLMLNGGWHNGITESNPFHRNRKQKVCSANISNVARNPY
jgi:hypothetical protein